MYVIPSLEIEQNSAPYGCSASDGLTHQNINAKNILNRIELIMF